MSRVIALLIAPSPHSAMESQTQVRAAPGRGLEGDRYFFGVGTFSPQPQKPDYEITFVEQEQVAAYASESGTPFTSAQMRRNVVTEGVALNALVGKEFLVGAVRIRGVRLCEPCTYLAKIAGPGTLRGFVHKGGLRAQILSEAFIALGDLITF